MSDYRIKLVENAVGMFPKAKEIEGSGIVNTVIDNLPFELHIPGYKYTGPGTNLDLNLSQGIKPVNKLDEAAMYHDMAYARSDDLDKRHEADKVLEYAAWDRVKADDADFGEKAAAYLTTNVMKIKRALGAGLPSQVKKQVFTKYPINLDEREQLLILEGIKLKKPITLDLGPEQLIRTKDSVMNETYLPLSSYQIKQVKKTLKKQKSIKLKISVSQLDYINDNNKTGGFLPALMKALPVIVTVATSLVNAYNNKKANDKLVEERIKRGDTDKENLGYGFKENEKVLEFINFHKNNQKNIAAAKKKHGKGFYVNSSRARSREVDDEGLSITTKKKN